VVHEVAGRVIVHSVVAPEVTVTVPVAPAGSPDTDTVTGAPNVVVPGVTVTASAVSALVTSNVVGAVTGL
jgi:hypothetical protein